MSPRTVRLLLMLGAFVTGLVLFSSGHSDRRRTQSRRHRCAVGRHRRAVPPGRSERAADDRRRTYKGKPFLVFFGFTHCPDMCPTALFEMSEILRALGPDADRVNALFVTVDPERDTPAKLKDYLSSFEPQIHGLTGEPEAITAVEKGYRAYAKKVPLKAANTPWTTPRSST